jgi:hypothetical protein
MIARIAFCLFAAVWSSNALALQSTEELLSVCRVIASAPISEDHVQFQQTFETGECWGAFLTIQTVIAIVDYKTHVPYFHVCPPSNGTATQLISIFVQYAQTHPKRLNEDYFFVVLDSLRDAFPCK